MEAPVKYCDDCHEYYKPTGHRQKRCPNCARLHRNKTTNERYHRNKKITDRPSRAGLRLVENDEPDSSPEAVADRLKFRKWMDNRKKEGKSDGRLSGKNEAKLSKYEPTYYDNLFYPTPEAAPESRRSV